ncbi:hypothetical protein BCV72DRAFT_226059 [Rhizopus microsporus var. microsporus]|uniref:Uncharacterized protein n=1 Tax=Rhizopus microsporus var. microsporus TaxID=86635 RepID=A0A1X0R6W1_RHIZD|nr:hypothetical protein BCV72DRAFT_226059 [Rhizopus microsporus var. microsporus]
MYEEQLCLLASNIEALNEKYSQKLKEFEDQANEETVNAKKRQHNDSLIQTYVDTINILKDKIISLQEEGVRQESNLEKEIKATRAERKNVRALVDQLIQEHIDKDTGIIQ